MKKLLLSLLAVAAFCTPASAQNKVKNLSASNATLNMEQILSAEQTVQLNRYLFAGYNTLCLPMSFSAEQLASSDIRLERFVGIQQEGNVLNLYFLECTAEGIEAGEPYLIYSPNAQMLRVKNSEAKQLGNTLKTIRLTDNQGNAIAFGSSWGSVNSDGRYGIPAKQATTPLQSILERTTSDKTFLPTRCGFVWEQQAASASELCIKHITSLSEATGINRVTESNTTTDLYDLNGRKVSRAQKGIVIENGRKVLK